MGFASMILLSAAAAPAPGVEGNWLTDDGKGVVQITPCGPKMCGRIVQVLDKGPGVPATDVKNPDPALRKRPILGLVTLWGLSRKGEGWSGGRAYDPKSGKAYRATLGLYPGGALKVTGCVLFICQSRRWTRHR